uniref:Glutathione peroxidase n=1 Tax=Gossypium raimondii TaxID=29730 RepID=A0A0D2R8J6_GOSRA|nr:hypothetical protein B456_004G215500 [Gossypium raimondii]
MLIRITIKTQSLDSLPIYILQPKKQLQKNPNHREKFTKNPKLLTFLITQNTKMGASESVPQKSIHEFTVKDYKNQDVDLSMYRGKALLVVNVASKCGLTDSNYTQLTDLYNKYKDQGLEILAFPCNQFLSQEPGTSQDAQEFACTRYKAEYPIFQKVMKICMYVCVSFVLAAYFVLLI